ncbi:polymer-forming cytoskeletal protein [bacterium]|nr:polymer-forming cytoskeletal protein [bacterium]
MSALFNTWVIKVVFTFIAAIFMNPHVGQIKQVGQLVPVFIINRESPSDSLNVGEEKKDLKKSVKISISDDGIKINSGGKEQFILGVDSKNAINSLVKKGIKSIPESLSVNFNYDDENNSFNFTYNDEKKYSHVINKDRVKVGDKIHVKDDELIQGDVVSIMGGITVDGKVRGDVVCVLGNIELGPSSVVNGDVVCVLGNLSKDDGARVRGETVTIGTDKFSVPAIAFLPFGGGVLRFIVQFAKFTVLVLLLLLVLYFTSERIKKGSTYVAGSFLKSLGVGVLIVFFGSIVVVIVAVILSITIIGIPLSLLLFLSYIAFLLLCYFVTALALGSFVAGKMKIATQSVYLQGLIGLFLLELPLLISSMMGIIPIFTFVRIPVGIMGKFIVFLALLVGVGAFILSKGGVLTLKSDNLTQD